MRGHQHRRIIAWFLTMALLAGSLSLPAFAQEITPLDEPPIEQTQTGEEEPEPSGTILSWEWEGGSLSQNTLRLVTPDPQNPLTWEEVVRQLPQSIRATLQPDGTQELVPGASEETLAPESREISLAGWSSPDGTLGEGSVLPTSGSFTLEAALPEGYVLASDAPQLQVTVELDSPAPASDGQVETTYLDANGEQHTVMATPVTVPEGSYSVKWTSGWYVVDTTIETYASFTVSGDVHLILADGCTLNTKNGIYVTSFWNGNLTIYGQSTEEGTMGKLIAKNSSGYSAIGGSTSDTGTITINGGHITASTSGRTSGAAIGGGKGRSGGVITINGGIVEATASGESGITSGSAAIGGGASTGGSNNGGDGGVITINGGRVTAISDSTSGGAGIGGGSGSGSSIGGSGGTITITGGTVVAKSGRGGAGIGGGSGGSGKAGSSGTIQISGGDVTAQSTGTQYSGAGIGSGHGGTASANTGSVQISGGTVHATGGGRSSNGGAGIGGGSNTSGGTIEITGGTVTATSGYSSFPDLGGGSKATEDSTITITGGTLCTSQEGEPTFSTAPTNGSQPVYYTTVDLTGLYEAKTPVTDAELSGYGFDGVTTDSQCRLHLYLPEGVATASFQGADYTGNVTPDGPNELTTEGLTLMAQVDEVTPESASLILTTQKGATVYYVESETPISSPEEVLDVPGVTEHPMTEREERVLLENLQTGKEYHYYLAAQKDGKFSNLVDLHFSTQLLNLEQAEVTLSETEFPYDGQTKVPQVTVKLEGETLVSGVDYQLELESSDGAQDQIHPGTVSVLVTGMGKYTGEAAQKPSYTIHPAPLTVSITGELTKEYDGTTEPPQGAAIQCTGQVGSDEVSVRAGSFAYNSPHVQEATRLTAESLSLEGRDAAYYTIETPSVSADASITKSNPNIDFGPYYGKTYDTLPMELPTDDQMNLVGAGYEDLTFTWYQGDQKLESAPVHAGRYTLEASIPAGADTNGATSYRWISIAPKNVSPAVDLEQLVYTYDGTPKEPKVLAVRDGDVVIPSNEYLIKYTENTNAGTAMILIEDQPEGDYIVNGVAGFTIEKGQGQLSGLSISSSSVTYGDTFTVSFTPTAESIQARTTLSADAPGPQEAKLYLDGQLLATVTDAYEGQTVTFTVDTTGKTIPASCFDGNSHLLLVQWGGDDNLTSGTASLMAAFYPKALTGARVDSASPSASKVYDGTPLLEQVALTDFQGLHAGDQVTAVADGMAQDADAAPAKAFSAQSVTLSGADAGYYRLDPALVEGTVAITQAAYPGEKDAQGAIGAGRRDTVALPELPAGASYQTPSAAQPQAFEELSVSGTTLHYTGSASVEEDSSYTVTVPVTGAVNYQDYTVTVTLTGTPTYQLTVEGGSGSGAYALGQTVTITAENRPGYRFQRWTSDPAVELANATAATTTFSMPGHDLTLTAVFEAAPSGGNGGGSSSGGSSSGSGSSGGTSSSGSSSSQNGSGASSPSGSTSSRPGSTTTVTSQPAASGDNNEATILHSTVAQAIREAQQQSSGNPVRIEVPVTTDSQQTAQVTLPNRTLTALADQQVNEFAMLMEDSVTVTLEQTTLRYLSDRAAGADLLLRVEPKQASVTTGGRPVYDISLVFVENGQERPISELGSRTVQVALPYTPAPGELVQDLGAVYIDENGQSHWMEGSYYDAEKQAVLFQTNHFSLYGVASRRGEAAPSGQSAPAGDKENPTTGSGTALPAALLAAASLAGVLALGRRRIKR